MLTTFVLWTPRHSCCIAKLTTTAEALFREGDRIDLGYDDDQFPVDQVHYNCNTKSQKVYVKVDSYFDDWYQNHGGKSELERLGWLHIEEYDTFAVSTGPSSP